MTKLLVFGPCPLCGSSSKQNGNIVYCSGENDDRCILRLHYQDETNAHVTVDKWPKRSEIVPIASLKTFKQLFAERGDLYEARDAFIADGRERWRQLTADWSQEDRKWAWEFIAACSQPWA